MKKKNYFLSFSVLFIAFIACTILFCCAVKNLVNSPETTKQFDNVIKHTHKIVNHVDSVWSTQNDSVTNIQH